MEKILVTGVSGFVGNHLTDELISHGYEVVGVGRDAEIDHQLRAKLSGYTQCDMADYEAVEKLPIDRVKAVINLAGLAAVGKSFDNPDLYMRVNPAVIDTICQSALKQGRKDLKILAISSGAVYDNNQSMPLSESSETNPNSSPYAKSKLAMEALTIQYREQGLDCIVARPFNHIGPGQGEGFLLPDLYKKVIESQNAKTPLVVGNIATKRDYTDVRDVANAYVRLISEDTLQNSIYNVCSGRSLSGEEILAHLTELLDLKDLSPVVDAQLFRPSDAPDIYGDGRRIQSDTGWGPTISIKQTIADFIRSQHA